MRAVLAHRRPLRRTALMAAAVMVAAPIATPTPVAADMVAARATTLSAATAKVVAAATATPAATPEASVAIGMKHVLGGLGQAVQVTSAKDGSNRLFVVQKTGRVLVIKNGVLLATPYLDLSSVVSTSGEEGLLSIAFRPDFATTPWLFAAYTARNGSLVVVRFIAPSAAADSINVNGALLLQVAHPTYTNHNGGQLAFGPDRLLYIGTGDGGGAGDPFAHAQDLHSLSGKILRIDPLRSCPNLRYCIPSGNRFATSLAYQRAIWLSGVRNPWRFSVDPSTGWVWIGDVGQDAYEEVDVVASGYSWLNMGWSCREGLATYNSSRCIAGQPYRNPLVVVPHPLGESIIGGFVYRGSIYASTLGGLYVFGDYVTGHLWVYRYTGSAVLQTATLAGLSSFGTSDGDELYAVTLGGDLYRVTATAI